MTKEQVRAFMDLSRESILIYIRNRDSIDIESDIDKMYDAIMLEEWNKIKGGIK